MRSQPGYGFARQHPGIPSDLGAALVVVLLRATTIGDAVLLLADEAEARSQGGGTFLLSACRRSGDHFIPRLPQRDGMALAMGPPWRVAGCEAATWSRPHNLSGVVLLQNRVQRRATSRGLAGIMGAGRSGRRG